MSSFNSVTLVGNVGNEIQLKYTPQGTAVTELRVATNEFWKGKDGVAHKSTEWHRVVVWSSLAENCAKYLSKGRSVLVSGRLQTRSYEAKDGTKRYITEIVARNVQFLGSATKTTDSQVDTSVSSEEETVNEMPVSVRDMVF